MEILTRFYKYNGKVKFNDGYTNTGWVKKHTPNYIILGPEVRPRHTYAPYLSSYSPLYLIFNFVSWDSMNIYNFRRTSEGFIRIYYEPIHFLEVCENLEKIENNPTLQKIKERLISSAYSPNYKGW